MAFRPHWVATMESERAVALTSRPIASAHLTGELRRRQEGVRVLQGSMTAAQLTTRLGRVNTMPDLRAHLTSEPPGRLFLMFWGGMAVIGGASLVGAPAIIQIGVAAVLLVGCNLNQPYWAALAIAMVAWLLVTGFVVNQYDLHLSGKGDLVRL